MADLLEEKLAALQTAGISQELIAHIRDHIEHEPPAGMLGISAFRMAEEWGTPRTETLEAFLYGTRLGLFDLSWDIRCPSCKGVTEHVEHLNALTPDAHCEYCKIDYQAGFDDQVEVRFSVNESIRPQEPVDGATYIDYWDYLEETGRVAIPANATREATFDLQPGTYYVKTPDPLFGIPLVVEAPATQEQEIFDLTYAGEHFEKSGSGIRNAGPITLRITNPTPEPIEAVIIHRNEHPWVSAAHVASTQSFRDLFSSELISPDETFGIRNLVFVFTDIRGSTALYERLGDSDAYYLVKEHFRILTDTVKKHNGAVVKTIGDAVMATFMASDDAAAALFDMQHAFDLFNQQENIRDEIIIKVGAHRGPCIAVNSNDRLDYFGRTVNIAARVQGLSTGGDIMLSQDFYDENEVKPVADGSGWQKRHLQAKLRGMQAIYDIIHLTPPGAPAA